MDWNRLELWPHLHIRSPHYWTNCMFTQTLLLFCCRSPISLEYSGQTFNKIRKRTDISGTPASAVFPEVKSALCLVNAVGPAGRTVRRSDLETKGSWMSTDQTANAPKTGKPPPPSVCSHSIKVFQRSSFCLLSLTSTAFAWGWNLLDARLVFFLSALQSSLDQLYCPLCWKLSQSMHWVNSSWCLQRVCLF